MSPNLSKKSKNEYSKLLKAADFMEPLAFFLSIKINHMMKRLKRVLLLYGENITLDINILVLIVSNHFSLRKTTLKLRVMRHLLRNGVNGEEFVRFPLNLIRKTFQKLNLQVQRKNTRKLITNLSEKLLKIHGTYYRIKVKLEMHYLFIRCMC